MKVLFSGESSRLGLIAIDVKDLKFLDDGTGAAADPALQDRPGGRGHIAYVSRQTVRSLQPWLKIVGINDGPVFRRIIGRGTVTYNRQWEGKNRGGGWPGVQDRPGTSSSRRRICQGVSGHSLRVVGRARIYWAR